RLQMRTDETFHSKLPQLANLIGVQDTSKLRFLLNGQMFATDQTPAQMKIGIADIIECIMLERREAGAPVLDDPNLIQVKIRDSKAHKNAQIEMIKINKLEPFSNMFSSY